MTTIQVQIPFTHTNKVASLWEFMGMAFDYYNDLEDKLFGHIITNTDLNDTVDTDEFLANLHNNHEAADKQSIHKGHKMITK